MSHLDLETADFWFRCPALKDETLRVYRFTGREALNQPLVFAIELVSADPNLPLDALLGQPGQLTLRGRHPDGRHYERCVRGVIARAVQLAAGPHFSVYRVTLSSMLAMLGQGRDRRIFQDLSTPDVVLAVLREGGIAGDAVQPLLHDSYRRREFCVQYAESRLQFLQRLLEHEGICFFFDPQADRELLLLGDGAHAFSALPESPFLRHRDGPHLYEEGVWEFQDESALLPEAAVLRDFYFPQPGLDMEASAATERGSNSLVYDFPGGYENPADGQRLAKVRLQEQLCQRHRYRGRSNVRALAPGFTFTLSGHHRTACNQPYLIVEVAHRGVQPQALPSGAGAEALGLAEPERGPHQLGYQNRVLCQPAGVVFRPARLTARPQLAGAQTAVVIGPAGEEIHCDEYGRVKLRFPWDRREECGEPSSGWVRVSQPWSGIGHGGVFLPRIGQEVVVVFLGGDPDQPLIVGRVGNGENPVPYPLPAAKTISTLRSASTPGGEGYNELRFEDAKGREQLHLHAERELSIVVGHDHNHHVAADERCTVDGDRSLTVKGSLRTVVRTGDHSLRVESGSSLSEIKGSCKTTVESGQSELWVLAGGHITKAEGPVTLASGRGRLNLVAAGPWHGKSKQRATLEAPELSLRASRKLTLAVGSSTITLDESGVAISGPQVTSSAVGTHAISGALITIN